MVPCKIKCSIQGIKGDINEKVTVLQKDQFLNESQKSELYGGGENNPDRKTC